jgi:hypothetical protein
MADDPAVTCHAPDRLDADRSAVDELGSPDPTRQRVDVGNQVQGVAIGIGGAGRSLELSVAGPNQVEQAIDTPLTWSGGRGFS